MKTITLNFIKITVLFSLFFSLNSNAQSSAGMTYQAVIRNSSNALVANTLVGIKISILQTSATGTVVYSERHTPTTNANGLATLIIGAGTSLSGDYGTINWGADTYYLKTETDPTGGTLYTIVGTSQFMSVPYAKYAEKSGDAWGLSGNTITTTEFIGSTNNVDLVFKRNNAKAGGISKNENTSLGTNSLFNLDTNIGSNNSAFGSRALQNNNSGFNNTAVGTGALGASQTNNNTAVGVASILNNTTGMNNTAVGYYSLKDNVIGNGNTAIGNSSLERNTGFYNTAVGLNSLNLSTGDQNTAIGWRALESLTTGGGNIAIGKIVDVPSPTTNNQLSIGNVIYGTNMGNTATGTIGIGVPVPTEKLEVAGKTKTTNLQVTNGAGVNKVLTSDAIGNATWQTSNANTGIHITKTTSQIIVPNITTTIDFSNEETDDANAFNPTTDEWTIPSTGFYHINVSSRFNPALPLNYQATIHLFVNGVSTKFKGHVSTGNLYQNFDFSTDVKLNANDIVTIRIVQNTISGTGGANATLSGSAGDSTFYLSGFKVY